MATIRTVMRSVTAAALALGVAAAAPTLAHAQGYGPGMMGGYGWGGGWGFGGIGMVLWWILIILGIALLAKWLLSGSSKRGDHGTAGRALDILKERYARGEIDKQEYDQRKRDLE